MSAFAFSGSNVYIPSLESAGYLTINFSRNPDRFSLNKYIGIRKVDKDVGYYTVMKSEEGARVINLQDYIWPAGNDEPQGNVNAEQFDFSKYTCTRYAYPFALDWKAVQQASWNVLAQYAALEAAKAMTARTVRCVNVLTTGANWGSNTASATSSGGGKWDVSSTTNLYMKKSIMAGLQAINKATNGVVQPKDCMLVLNPTDADRLSRSPEVHDYMKGSYWSHPVLESQGFIEQWGLPPILYGLPVVIEDAVQVTSRKPLSRTDQYVWPTGSAAIVARPDGLNAGIGAGPSFNTFTLFAYEEFTVESFDDVNNRRVKGRVVEDTAEVLTAPASGYLFTAISG